MFFKQYYLSCLAQASYLLGDQGEAAVVDPQRDVDQYIEEAAQQGLRIKYIIETHLHADFVSGHVELAKRTGAKIYLGARAGAEFSHVGARDGDEIRLGGIVLRFLETPGHTPESLTVLVTDPRESKEPKMMLTGDTLFIGDVGRPDLVGSKGISAEAMAGMLYDSLWEKLLTYADSVLVYPAHGAGSACGRFMSQETFSTLGEQKKNNYALKKMARQEFIRLTTTDLPEAPQYFSHDAEANRRGAVALEELPALKALTPGEVVQEAAKGVLLLDLREARFFGSGHVPGSVNIALTGMFAPWAGALLGPQQKVILIGEDESQVREGQMRLARVGLESVVGFLDGGIAAWDRAQLPLRTLAQWPVAELQAQIAERKNLVILDVRKPAEFAAGHVAGAVSLPLNDLQKNLSQLDPQRPVAIICGSGFRSSAAASYLLSHPFKELYNVMGGMAAWKSAGFPMVTVDDQ